jgi:hypothetical protein
MGAVIGFLIVIPIVIAIGTLFLFLGINYGLSAWIEQIPKITFWQAFFLSFIIGAWSTKSGKKG